MSRTRRVILLIAMSSFILAAAACSAPAPATPTVPAETAVPTVPTETAPPTQTPPAPTPGGGLIPLGVTPQPLVIGSDNMDRLAQFVQLPVTADGIYDLAYSPDGRMLAVATSQGVALFDVETQQQTGALVDGQAIQSVTFSPDGRLLAILPSEPGSQLQIWDMTTNQESDLLKGKLEGVIAIGFSPDGSLVATGSSQGIVTLWDTATQQEVRSMNLNDTIQGVTGGQTLGVGKLIFSPDGATLAGEATFGAGVLVLWNVADGSVQHTATAMNHIAGPVATPLLAPGDWSKVYWWSRGTIMAVDIASDQEGVRFDHEDFVMGAAFSPDGRLLATGSSGTVSGQYVPIVKLWDVASGQELRLLTDFASVPTAIAFSPDGTRLAIAVSGQGVGLWGILPY